MKKPEQHVGLHGQKSIFVQVLTLFLVLFAPLAGRAQNGNGMFDAIQMGDFYDYDFYFDNGNNYFRGNIYYQDNYSPGNYTNAQPSPDVWYSFTATSNIGLDLSSCGSTFNVYVHLLDSYGNEIANIDPSGCSLGYQELSSGTYYIVVEGEDYSTGDFYFTMSTYLGSLSSPGANMSNAINAGTLMQGTPYVDTRSNADALLGDDIGQSSYDIYYKFTLNSTSEVALSHCGSGIDTYMHLLNGSGLVLATNDNNYSSPCPGSSAYIQTTLPAGTYYLVSEGYGSNSGSITTGISVVPPSSQPPVISYSSPATLQVGVLANLSPTNTGGAPAAIGGVVSAFVGSGTAAFVNGTGTAASFNQPAGGVFDAAGNFYIPDIFNHRIRKITPSGVVTTFAGSGTPGSTNGIGTAASFNKPYRLAKDAAGNIYVSDRESNKVRKITPSGVVSTLAGSGAKSFADGAGNVAAFSALGGIAVDASGNVYVADQGNHRVRKITPSGMVSTLAGSGSSGSTDGSGTSARFNYPLGMSIDASGNLYVADYNNHKIRKVTPSGVVSTFAGSGTSGSTDGPASSATFDNPLITQVDAQGTVYVTDMNHKIRKISGGVVSTVAGTGSIGSADGPALSATFRTPHGLMFDSNGDLYIMDTENHKIRKLVSSPAYSISPALPAGLVLNTVTGQITGTPTAVSAAKTYTITASNSAGSGTATVSITVLAAPANPSQDRNYIHILTPREPIADAANLSLKTAVEVQQTVQYFDGLGRALQTVEVKASSGALKDIVQPMAYDSYGREARKYLPYASSTGTSGTFRADALTAVNTFYNPAGSSGTQLPVGIVRTTKPYGETLFEASPLNRVLEQGAPGEAWQPAATRGTTGRTVVMDHASNNIVAFTDLLNTRMVALYGVSLDAAGVPTLTLTTAYPVNQLYVTISKDENWLPSDGRNGTVEEYRDKQDRVVLKRAFNKKGSVNEMLSTYYVYDDFGNLSFVLPPGINPDRTTVPTVTELNNFAYRYQYDGRNRLVEKRLPGKDVEYLVYNKLDQLVATQDAVQRAVKEWTVSKYDALGRMVLSGIWNNGGVALLRPALQTLVDGQLAGKLWEIRTGTTGTGYSNVSWPTSTIARTLMLNYYDDYLVPGYASLPAAYRPVGHSGRTRGLPTVVMTNVLGTTGMLWSINYYDDKGQVVKQFAQHFKDGVQSVYNYDDISNVYNFSGQLTQNTRKHYTGTGSAVLSVTVITDQSYDHMGRALDTKKTVNTPTVTGTATLIARNVYNEIGQLKEKKVGSINNGSTFDQSTSYAYNERGWLVEAVSPLFKQYLKYNEGTTPQYNGNIARQDWQHGTSALQSYTYSYDKLNRLSEATMAGSAVGAGRETLVYDKMGNISSLVRTGINTTVKDQLAYTYAGNRLSSVADAVTAVVAGESFQLGGATAYTYDVNGNMKTRTNAVNTGNNITAITYNHLNLPQSVTAASGNVTYTYDATGRKLRSVGGIVGQTRDYIDGIEYVAGAIELIQMEEGRMVRNGSSYTYEYYLVDHLGNSRSGFKGGSGTVASLRSDYYAFGMQYPSNLVVGSPKNNYLYNGKELQDGLKLYDYGARLYDPAIGRWSTIDPLADHPNQIGMSPYSAFWNNPILYDDPDGQCPFCPWLDAVVDVGFVLYDVGVLVHEKITTGSTSGANWAALGADGVSILVPMSVGAGAAVRASVKAVNKVDNAADVAKTADKAGDAKKTYQTYTKDPKNPSDGVYSGKTSGKGTPEQNVANRDKSHHKNETHGPAKLDKSSSNPDAIRGREQQNIKNKGGAKSQGGTSGNAINGVSPKNKNAQKYEQAAKKEFGN